MRHGYFIMTIATAAAALLIGVAAVKTGAVDGPPHRFHVDYEHGNDANDGTTPRTAWKHAPGDAAASGRPSLTNLIPGDHVIFAGGVVYRGAIRITASGTPEKPIVFEGAADGKATIDGSDPISFTGCTSPADCAGLSSWSHLVRARLPQPMTEGASLFADQGFLRMARDPDPADPFYADETSDMTSVDSGLLQQGEAPVPAQLQTPTALLRIALWVRPNLVIERNILSTANGKARFDPTGINFYTDRPSKIAFLNHPASLNQPGEYISLPDGSLVISLPPEARRLGLATGRGGFELKHASNIVIRKLSFAHMASGGKLFDGIAIFSNQRGNSGLEIDGCEFRDMFLSSGQGPITLRGMSGLAIHDNRIETIVGGSGIRLSGPGAKLTVSRNYIRRVGRTAIMLMSLDDALVENNFITDIRGVHGNGLSAYLENHRIKMVGNIVIGAKQPVTFRGGSPTSGDTISNDLVFDGNLLVGTPDALGSLISWGAATRNVQITNNILLGGRFGLRLNATDTGVTISGNSGVPPMNLPSTPANWRLGPNSWSSAPATSISSALARAQDREGVCSRLSGHGGLDPAQQRALGCSPSAH